MLRTFWIARPPLVLLAAAAVLAALGGVTAIASAQQARNLRLVTSIGERPDAVLPAYTRSVTARYDYTDASDTAMTLLVYAPGGLRLMRADARHNGSGTATVDITGQALMTGLGASLVANGQEMQRSAGQAAAASRGVREYLNGVEAATLLVKTGLRTLRYTTVEPELAASVGDMRLALDDMDRLIARARLLDESDDNGLRGVATQMAGPAGRVVAAARVFESQVKDRPAAIMPTGRGVREAEGYLLEVLVEGIPAASTHMWVKVPIYLPFTTK